MSDFKLNLQCGMVISVTLLGDCKEHANEYFWDVQGAHFAGGFARGYDPDFAVAKAKAITAAHTILKNSSVKLIESI